MPSTEGLKARIRRDFDELKTMRDEIRIKLSLASMEAKTYWKQLEPRLEQLEQKIVHDTGEQAIDATQKLMSDVSTAVRKFRDRLAS
jgi:vacuolar-type H+-ATPase subunit H